MSRKLWTNRSWRRSAPLFIGVLLMGSAQFVGTAAAEDVPRLGLHDVMRLLEDDPTIPPEWAGVWTTVDSTFTCTGTLVETMTYSDTLCTGDSANEGGGEGPVTQVTCTGTTDATSANITCTGSMEVFLGCTAVFTSEMQATRSGDSYTATATVNVNYSGTATGCSSIPTFCQVVKSHATRVATEPEECGGVAAETASWGLIKRLYH